MGDANAKMQKPMQNAKNICICMMQMQKIICICIVAFLHFHFCCICIWQFILTKKQKFPKIESWIFEIYVTLAIFWLIFFEIISANLISAAAGNIFLHLHLKSMQNAKSFCICIVTLMQKSKFAFCIFTSMQKISFALIFASCKKCPSVVRTWFKFE